MAGSGRPRRDRHHESAPPRPGGAADRPLRDEDHRRRGCAPGPVAPRASRPKRFGRRLPRRHGPL